MDGCLLIVTREKRENTLQLFRTFSISLASDDYYFLALVFFSLQRETTTKRERKVEIKQKMEGIVIRLIATLDTSNGPGNVSLRQLTELTLKRENEMEENATDEPTEDDDESGGSLSVSPTNSRPLCPVRR